MLDLTKIKVYVCGGFVRDTLLGLEPKDMDFVVVGATPEEMLDLGFSQVGADFPVFLDLFGREWALARKERKVGVGYHGFECEFDPTVTLEEDLFRRDLTVNAMAMPVLEIFDDGQIIVDTDTVIDPFGGRKDMTNGTLRHVSEHFAEDPVRVLRVARFSARYGLGIDHGTLKLIDDMAQNGELDHLVPERVWAEMEKAVTEKHFHRFFHVLDGTAALRVIFPELSNVKQFWSVAPGNDRFERFALLALLLGATKSHSMFTRLKAPSDVIDFTYKFCLAMTYWAEDDIAALTAEDMLLFLKTHDCFRDRDFLPKAVLTAEHVDCRALELEKILKAQEVALLVGFDDLTDDQKTTLKGPAIGQAIDDLRLEKIREMIRGLYNP